MFLIFSLFGLPDSMFSMKPFLFIISFFFLFTSCEKDESPSGYFPPAGQPSFTFTMNGVNIQADSANAYYLIDTSMGIPLRIFSIISFFDDQILSPGFVDTINSLDFSGVNYQDIMIANLSYEADADTINLLFGYHEISAAFAVTHADSVNQLISGTFSGVVVNDSLNDTLNITNGVYTNIKYHPL